MLTREEAKAKAETAFRAPIPQPAPQLKDEPPPSGFYFTKAADYSARVSAFLQRLDDYSARVAKFSQTLPPEPSDGAPASEAGKPASAK